MSDQIKILPDFIANQIAAGEVVQRPESVVKELIENAVDSGATEIGIVIRGAGKKLIHIIDNGSGMSLSDLKLSIKRHATSKILNQEDLQSIKTFGFRGEALASIASVSHLEILTKTPDKEVGYKLISEPNKEPNIEETFSENGTQVLVRNLFYNTPARRKFLKSDLTEFRHISETVIKFAISNPDKRITFYDNDNLVFDLKPENLIDRIKNATGNKLDDLLLEVFSKESELIIKGFIGKPYLAKQGRGNQYLFLNNRPIISKYLNHAIYSRYEDLIDDKKYPFFVIFLEIDFEKVDVNVHPQKHEVKFENEQLVYNLVKNAVEETLRNSNLIPEFNLGKDITPFTIDKDDSDNEFLVNKNTGEVINQENDESEFSKNQFHNRDKENNFSVNRRSLTDEDFDNLFKNEESVESKSFFLISNKYVVFKEEEGLLVVHIRRAHQRIYFEKFMNRNNKIESQDLLFPVVIDLNKDEKLILSEILEELQKLGFSIILGDSKVEIHSAPSLLNDKSIEILFKKIIENYTILNTDSENLTEIISKSIAMSINVNINNIKINFPQFKRELLSTNMPHINPLGKMSLMRIPLKDLENRFNSQ